MRIIFIAIKKMVQELKYSKKELGNALILREAYFNTAIILCRYISIKSSPKKLDNNDELKNQEKTYYENIYKEDIEYMIHPLLFNLRHGMELYLKLILLLGKIKIKKNMMLKNI